MQLGSMVKVVDVAGLTADQLQMDIAEFAEFLIKTEVGKEAILIDFHDDGLVDIVYEDGSEVTISKCRLEVVDDVEDDPCFCPRLRNE